MKRGADDDWTLEAHKDDEEGKKRKESVDGKFGIVLS